MGESINLLKVKVVQFFSRKEAHIIFILISILLAYKNLFTVYFLSDDFDLLLGKYDWLSPVTGFFRPIPHLVIFLFYKIFGLTPLPFQIFSLLIHFMNSILIYTVIDKVTRNRFFALIAGLLFGPNFLISEAVFWISGVTSLLITLFYLLTILFYLNFLKDKKRIFYTFSIISFVLAFLSKENAFTLPLVLILLEIAYKPFPMLERGKYRRDLFKRLFPFFALFFGFLVIKVSSLVLVLEKKILYLGYHNIRNLRLLILSLVTFNVFNDSAFVFLDQKLMKFFSFIPDLYTKLTWSSIQAIFSLVLGTIIILLLLFLLLRGSKKVKIFLLIFLFSIGPFLLIQHTHEGSFSGFYKYPLRWYYLPAATFFIALGICFNRGYLLYSTKKRLFPVMISGIILFFGFLITTEIIKTQKRNADWGIASSITKNLLKDTFTILSGKKGKQKVIFFDLPDNFRGAYIFRNGIDSAVELMFPKNSLRIQKAEVSSSEYTTTLKSERMKKLIFLKHENGKIKEVNQLK